MQTYVLGGGCFWCIDAVFRRLKGVVKVESGYAGGYENNPSYYQVATGKTGHAEVVQVTFDETILPAEALLDIFFLIHDPTTLNRQGADRGTQYRSVMLYTNTQQKHEFEAAKARAQKLWQDPIVTQLELLDKFFVAESEHQDYFNKHPEAGYCAIVIAPKIMKARTAYKTFFRDEE